MANSFLNLYFTYRKYGFKPYQHHHIHNRSQTHTKTLIVKTMCRAFAWDVFNEVWVHIIHVSTIIKNFKITPSDVYTFFSTQKCLF